VEKRVEKRDATNESIVETRDAIEDRINRLFSQSSDQDDEISFLFTQSDDQRDIQMSEEMELTGSDQHDTCKSDQSEITKQEMDNTVIPIFIDCLSQEQMKNDELNRKFELQKQSLLVLEETVASLKLQLAKAQARHNAEKFENQQHLAAQSVKLLDLADENARLRKAIRNSADTDDNNAVAKATVPSVISTGDIISSFEKKACDLNQTQQNHRDCSTSEDGVIFVGWKHGNTAQKETCKSVKVDSSGLNKFDLL